MFIQTEETPNPATLKFLPGQTVLGTGTANFSEGDNTESSPLAKKLFGVDGVVGVFPVSYTHLRAPRDLSTSRMPSSA